VDTDHLPRHIGIIMDGNGRWAQRQGLPRTKGHLEGLKAAKRVVGYLAKLPIEYVTLYTFSTENWSRPRQEVAYLMGLIAKHLLKEMPFYREHNIRVSRIGDDSQLPDSVLNPLNEAAQMTRHHSGLQVNLAINYGGRDELIRAFNRLTEHRGVQPCTAADLESYLDTSGMPDPELILRSAGEQRLSNFLLWQGAYAEYCFVETCWPDWNEETVSRCLREYQRRKRKFGGLTDE